MAVSHEEVRSRLADLFACRLGGPALGGHRDFWSVKIGAGLDETPRGGVESSLNDVTDLLVSQ